MSFRSQLKRGVNYFQIYLIVLVAKFLFGFLNKDLSCWPYVRPLLVKSVYWICGGGGNFPSAARIKRWPRKTLQHISIFFLVKLQIEMLSMLMSKGDDERDLLLRESSLCMCGARWASCWEMFADISNVGQIDFLIFLHAVFNGGHNFVHVVIGSRWKLLLWFTSLPR